MEYLIRFTQWHETFRLAEIQAIADLHKIDLKIVSYSDEVSGNRNRDNAGQDPAYEVLVSLLPGAAGV